MADEGVSLDPVYHTEPVRIPTGALAAAGERLPSWAVPTLVTGAFALAWTGAGYARHDLVAYAVGFALALGVLVSAWGRVTREI